MGSFTFCRSDLFPEVYTRCGNAAFANFVAAISRTNSCDYSQQQNSVAATMIFMKLTVPHKEICCGDLSPPRVAATYRLVCPGLYCRQNDVLHVEYLQVNYLRVRIRNLA